MQLKRSKPRVIGGSLAAATCTLLGTASAPPAVAQELGPWEFDTAALYYGEGDGRVRDFSINAIARKEVKDDSFFNLTFAYDTLTGASPSGAVATPSAQTFTRPSGNDAYTIAANDQPLDDTFHDSRTAVSAGYTWPLKRLTTLDVGLSLSDEFDYTHTGFNAQVAHDFNNRNTTLSFGAALSNDSINPVGGAPIPLNPMREVDNLASKAGDETKDVVDFLVGLTQVINRQTLVQFNYSLSQSDGYLTDPYKILSVVDPVTGLPVAGPAGSGLDRYLYESRPGTRDKQSFFGLLKRDIGGDVFDISYRYMTDDWGVDSHTVDLHYRWNFDGGSYFQPHLRFYSQTAADFFQTVLFDGRPVPEFATADYRLGEFNAVTVGFKYGRPTSRGEFSTRLEVYTQTGDPNPGARVGSLTDLDLYPDLNAVIAQFSYRFGH
jgi:Protein of unknown function (DUF3570)